jgi:hypothetical protein
MNGYRNDTNAGIIGTLGTIDTIMTLETFMTLPGKCILRVSKNRSELPQLIPCFRGMIAEWVFLALCINLLWKVAVRLGGVVSVLR